MRMAWPTRLQPASGYGPPLRNRGKLLSSKLLREEPLDGRSSFVLERYPVDPKSGYSRQVVWLDQDEYRVWKVEYFDRKDDLLKTLTYEGYDQYLERYWRPRRMEMVNHQTGKSTELLWGNYQFQAGLSDGDFNRASLARIR